MSRLVVVISATIVVIAALASASAGASAATGYFETEAQTIDPGGALDAVSCVPGSTICVVDDAVGKLLYTTAASATSPAVWTPWSGPAQSPAAALACPSSSLCLVAAGPPGPGRDLYRANSLGGSFLLSISSANGVGSISCPSTSFCLSGQEGAGFIRYSTNPTKPSWTAVEIGSGAMTGASCISASFCAVADDSGHVYIATTEAGVKESSGWTESHLDEGPALQDIACISVGECLAVDGEADLVRLAIAPDGHASASRTPVPGASTLRAISCVGSVCATSGVEGRAFASTDSGATWIDRYGGSAPGTGVDCASALLCVAVFGDGTVASFNPATTVPPLRILTTSLAAGQAGAAYESDLLVEGGEPPYSWSATGLPRGVSIDAASGRISGTPSTASCAALPCPQPPARYSSTVTATDGNGTEATETFPIAVRGTEVRLGVREDGDGAGSVDSTPAGIAGCRTLAGACESLYEDGSEVTLTASPNPGSVFAGWSGGGCSGDGSCRLALGEDTEVTATFAKAAPAPPEHELRVEILGDGKGVVSGAEGAISCPDRCAKAFGAGARVTMSATAARGSRFAGWSGECAGRGSCSPSLDRDVTVGARFVRSPPQTKIAKAIITSPGRASFVLRAIGAASSFRCTLLGPGHSRARPRRCSARPTYGGLAAGRYRFVAQAVGPGGADPSPAVQTFRIRAPGRRRATPGQSTRSDQGRAILGGLERRR